MNVMARTVLLAEIAPNDVARLAEMPTLISMPEDGRMDEDLYLLPPIQYPDGKYYLKIGGEPASPSLTNQAEMTAWFRSQGSAEAAARLQGYLTAILPDLPVQSYHTDTCVISFTATGYPYIERLDDHLTILTGGNGAAAKSCDEIGRLGALAATGQPLAPEGYDTDFKTKFI
jgi:sarcosine oxidase